MKMLITYKKHLVNSKDEMSYLNHAQYMRAALVSAMLLLATMTTMAQGTPQGVRIHGNVYGGGNLADVQTNTVVNMSAGQVYGNVYGGGKGKEDTYTCDKAMVGTEVAANACAEPGDNDHKDLGTKVTISNGTVGTLVGEGESQTLKAGTGNVYGGGEIGRVEWNTQVLIGEGTGAPIIYGNVFGAGKGLETHGYSALVRGNSTVTIQGNAKVGYNVYGGGEMSTVGRYWVKGIPITACDGETQPTAPTDLPDGMPYQQRKGGICSVTIQGNAEIGYLGIDDKGHVFGAGKGVEPHFVASGEGASQKMVKGDSGNPDRLEVFTDNPTTGQTAKEAYLEFLQTLSLVTNSYVTIDGSAKVKGSVFGGSESGFVQHDTNVTIQGSDCEIGTDKYGNIFGGGKGLEDFAEAGKVKGNTTVTISSGTVKGNVYGGGRLGDVGTITKPADYNYTWKQSDGKTDNVGEHNTNATAANTGICTVTITGGTIGLESTKEPTKHGNVFGAGRGLEDTWWCEKAIAYATSVAISNTAVVKGNVYGGGQIGRVEDDAKVEIGTADGADEPDIRGSVFGAGAGLQTHGYSALVRGNAAVTVQGKAKVGGSVYGGGETASVGRFTVVGGLPKHPDSGGYCTVTIKDNAKIGTSGTGHNVFGACKGVTPEYVASGENRSKSMQLRTNAPSDNSLWSPYNNDDTSPFIWRYYATEEDYKAFLKTLALTSHPTVTIDESATVYGSVYGGGERGLTLGNVDVNITGGTVEQDVYGGGALADTNAANANADDYAVATVTAGETVVTGMYTRSGEGTDEAPYVYTKITAADTKAEAGITYYTTVVPSTINTTSVDLTGGLIKGDAYGGGLGQKNGFNGATSDIAATVYGDINVTLNGTAFNISNYKAEGHTDVVKSGRVFGCNNLLGSPQGNVTVTVYKTVYGNIHRTTEDSGNTGSATKNDGQHHNYEVAAVYGGGNLANYTTAGKKAKVIIETCDVSIESVYGGGNAAEVPETDVLVNGAYEIGTVFGGGNGNDPYTTDDGTNWVENPGANVNGNANTLLTGGYIHEAYGGSNRRGTITGNVTIDVGTGGVCTLDVGKVVGAGKNADVNGNLIVIMGCKPSEKVPLLFAGADDANVHGNVELTITSGNFGQVFGGNNAGGAIYGHIKLNIEETGNCDTPITIDELYLGGNQAAYSVYGYKTEDGKLVPQSADELRAAIAADNAGKTADEITALFNSDKQEDPELNIVACTYIGQVFGGGYGTGAYMYADPKVNINMIQGSKHSGVPTFMTTDPRLTAFGLDTDDNPNELGVIGTVYGGGNAADVYGNPTVNIGTLSTVRLHESLQADGVTYNMSEEKDVLGAYIVGNVFGGGKGEAKMTEGTNGEAFLCAKAMVNGDEGTHVNIGNGFVRGNVYGGGEVGRVEHNTAVTIGLESGASTPVVNGNVFGAGAGTNTHGYSALVRGNSTVIVQADSKVLGSVYGGGEKASVGKYKVVDGLPVALAPDNEHPNSGYCYVTIRGNAEIGPDDMEMTKSGGPSDAGHVFGAGKGVLPYEGYAATEKPQHMNGKQHLVDGAWDNKSWDDELKDYPAYSSSQAALDADYVKFIKSLALATQTVVTIEGNAFVKGSVYGGSENGYVQQNTKVNIQGDCQIGNGYVQMDDNGNYLNKLATPLTPLAVNRRYTSEEWGQGKLILDNNDRLELRNLVGSTYYQSSLPECASWLYGQAADAADRYAPYDREANATGNLGQYADGSTTDGGRAVGDDGHTFYGSVFGGGSGYYPYKPGRWFEDAGAVYGNTEVNITGGHILTNVYGGNEMTNVSGTCTVNFGGTATLGVPRTLKQIDAHPVTCYLFGAGKGDQRVFFNKSTNVKDVVVNITGGRIYGSVFGGGEDGHVLRNVTMTIGQQSTTGEGTEAVTTTSGPVIGTWGTSYVDGNVFGGGRGFGGDAYTAGNVAGSVTMQIKGGTMLGSIYGGGRLGSVGYGLFDAGVPGYGEMRDNTDTEDGFTDGTPNFFTKGRGHIDITISGGTIGNTHEYIVPNATNIVAAGISETDISKWTTDNEWKTWKTYHHISKTEFDTATGRLTHTKGGNVFAGGMGRFYQLDGTTYISAVDWRKLGCVKSTKLTITGGTIKSNVYGGGELGQVVGHHTTENVNLSTEISISGSNTQIGTEVKNGSATEYTFGSIFGSGYGSLIERIDFNGEETNPKFDAGLVQNSTKIAMSDGKVLASIYGGGEKACVGVATTSGETTTAVGDTYVTVSGGEIGVAGFGGALMGNVYGGGSGHADAVRSGKIFGNTNVTISGGTIHHNIYGGGAYGSVGDFEYLEDDGTAYGTKKVIGVKGLRAKNTGVATINITGGTIGDNGHENGMVFGSSRGDINEPGKRDDHGAWVYDTHVTIGTLNQAGPTIKGSVYGSGENGHTFHNTEVTVNSGTIGIASGADITDNRGTDDTTDDITYSGANYPFRGNVYGGGCGTDMYDSNNDGEGDKYNPLAGVVYGNATVTINGGHVVHNVYGAGAMGSVGKPTSMTKTNGDDFTIGGQSMKSGFLLSVPYRFEYPALVDGKITTGLTTVNIYGGIIGVTGTTSGDVYGAARGGVGESYEMAEFANVRQTTVNIGTGSSSPTIYGSVYGGGEDGHTMENAYVYINNGTIYQSVYGSGRGTDKYKLKLKKCTNDSEYDGEAYSVTAGKVYSNTFVEMTGGIVKGNVYGGGKMASIGKGNYSGGADDYAPMGYGETIKGNLWDGVSQESKDFLGTGKATVTITGGTVGTPAGMDGNMPTGNVFGGSQGEAAPNIFLQPAHLYNPVFHVANINEAEVTIGKEGTSSGPRIYGSVYGGGQDGHMRRDAKVTVYSGEIGNEYKDATTAAALVGTSDVTNPQWQFRGNVFGAGSGFGEYVLDYNGDGDLDDEYEYQYPDATGAMHTEKFKERGVSFLAGCVARFTEVDIRGGIIHRNVYGGGSVAGTGEPKFGGQTYEPFRKGDTAEGHGEGKQSMSEVTIKGGVIGEANYGGDVYGASRGDEVLLGADKRFTTSIWADVNIHGGTIYGDVYGGGELGSVKQDTRVNLLGGEIKGDAYGGGKGTLDVPADIGSDFGTGGNTTVELNNGVANDAKGCIVRRIFGCNNINGTPKGHAKVHVHKTQRTGATQISGVEGAKVKATPDTDGNYNFADFDVTAVYGGGNMSAYEPIKAEKDKTDDEKAQAYTEVIIDGCELTSIGQVYGGGNAASVPATDVVVNGTYEIGQAFGGGNGADDVSYDGGVTYVTNPGANVGYLPYNNDSEKAAKAYGTGNAHVTVLGGTVHEVYGGSNTKGNVRKESRATLVDADDNDCEFNVTDAYGGGRNALQDGDAILDIGCITGLGKAYGGASNADVNGNIKLNITNGTYGQVFGGNDMGGCVRGSITVNVEETGCRPVIIGELYGGGNEAAYSIYGYNDDGSLKTSGTAVASPTVNVRSFTSIGRIFGGGYGEAAKMVGDPVVNVDVLNGKYAATKEVKEGARVIGSSVKEPGNDGYDATKGFPIPSHAIGAIGAIQDVFGGGNAAEVVGTTHVNIGTEEYVPIVSVATGDNVKGYYTRSGSEGSYTYTEITDENAKATAGTVYYKKVVGVDIRGNVYGGGDAADVSGDTNVVIGQKK